jgi:hypothetical protein
MCLSWVRTEFEVLETEEFPCNIKFIKNKKMSHLQTKDIKSFEHWKEVLAGMTIQTDFHVKFHPIKMLG